jgi:nicotinamide riboside kinase
MKLIEAASNREKAAFVEVEKNMILSRYIDCFQSREGKIKDKDLINYRKDLVKTVKNI